MTSNTRNFGRYCALAAVAAGVIGAAALGLASMANANPGPVAPTTTTAPAPVGPGYQYYPDHYATPAPTQVPGWQGHHGPGHMN